MTNEQKQYVYSYFEEGFVNVVGYGEHSQQFQKLDDALLYAFKNIRQHYKDNTKNEYMHIRIFKDTKDEIKANFPFGRGFVVFEWEHKN